MLAATDLSFLADVNAVLNACAFVLICAGILAIKRGAEATHKRLMLTATAVSVVFLVSYLVYHANVGSVRFTHEGWLRWIYFPILISHVILAAVQVPLILMTIHAGLKDRRPRHRRLAKITTPIWLYVSLTGVVVYAMLYHL